MLDTEDSHQPETEFTCDNQDNLVLIQYLSEHNYCDLQIMVCDLPFPSIHQNLFKQILCLNKR